MVQNVTISPNYINQAPRVKQDPRIYNAQNPINPQNLSSYPKEYFLNVQNATLSASDKIKYLELLNFLKNTKISENSENTSAIKQLEILFKNGKLLSKTANNGSSVLDNLYSIMTTDRAYGLDKKNLISSTLDILCNPRYITQTFGDIPVQYQTGIIQSLDNNDEVKSNPESMNVDASGTCAAASIEVNMADKYPAEFARWVSELSSTKMELDLKVKLNSISKNKLEASQIINILEAQKKDFSFNDVTIKVDADKNAYIRAMIQDKHWDKGERNVADVLIQSAIMKLGSQNTYNSLNDTRAGKFNANSQGLIELEKTFVESLLKNKEITSLVYQQIDDEQNLVGYNCSFDKIEKHITDTLKSGDDVILGYVLTNETSGRTKEPSYNPSVDGAPNKVINGHEITIVDSYKDQNGKTFFVCIDTDDDSSDFVQYSADWLLPKIHHAGYPAKIVEADEKEIMKNVM